MQKHCAALAFIFLGCMSSAAVAQSVANDSSNVFNSSATPVKKEDSFTKQEKPTQASHASSFDKERAPTAAPTKPTKSSFDKERTRHNAEAEAPPIAIPGVTVKKTTTPSGSPAAAVAAGSLQNNAALLIPTAGGKPTPLGQINPEKTPPPPVESSDTSR